MGGPFDVSRVGGGRQGVMQQVPRMESTAVQQPHPGDSFFQPRRTIFAPHLILPKTDESAKLSNAELASKLEDAIANLRDSRTLKVNPRLTERLVKGYLAARESKLKALWNWLWRGNTDYGRMQRAAQELLTEMKSHPSVKPKKSLWRNHIGDSA